MIVNGRPSEADALGRRLDGPLRKELDSVRLRARGRTCRGCVGRFAGRKSNSNRALLPRRRAAKEIGLLLELATSAFERDGWCSRSAWKACSVGLELLADVTRRRPVGPTGISKPFSGRSSSLGFLSRDSHFRHDGCIIFVNRPAVQWDRVSSLFEDSTEQDQGGVDRAALSRLFGVAPRPTIQPPVPPAFAEESPRRRSPRHLWPLPRPNQLSWMTKWGLRSCSIPSCKRGLPPDASELLERIDGLIHELTDPDHVTDARWSLAGACTR